MLEVLHELSQWLVGFAESDWAIAVLALTSFVEAIFFPIPPDPLLIGIAILRPGQAIWLGVLVTITSVAGALVGHWIGRRVGRPILYRISPADKVQLAERLLNRFGVTAILIFAITPLPYKLFAISAGVLNMDRRTFAAASLVGRGARFITLGVLLYLYGPSIELFITDNFELLAVASAIAVVAAAMSWGLIHGRRRAKGAAR